MKINFLIHYEIDQQTVKTVGDEDGAWVLLDRTAAAAAAGFSEA